MPFLSQDLTDQYISSSYQSLVQEYISAGPMWYVLNGYGNVIFQVPSASYGGIILTQDQTSSYAYNAISSSYALTQSYIISQSLNTTNSISASFASSSLSSSYSFSSSYALTSTIADVSLISDQALTSSYAGTASVLLGSIISSSYSLTSSFSLNGGGLSIGTGSTYPITSSWSGNSLTASFIDFIPATASNSITSSYLNGFPFDTTTLITNQTASNIIVLQRLTGSYNSGFFNYTVFSSSNLRSGQVISGWLNNTTSFTDVTIADIGNTSQVSMSVSISQSYVQLIINTQLTNNWTIKTTGTYI